MTNKLKITGNICFQDSPEFGLKITPPKVEFELEMDRPSTWFTEEESDASIMEEVFRMIGSPSLYTVVNINVDGRWLDTSTW